ncbi:hypothetical protein ACWD33_23935 [Streptomyces xiamenensis]
MRTNDAMRRLLGDVDVRELGIDDVPGGLRSVLERGWTATGDGAYLLRGFLDGYVGDLDAFQDVVALETAVNGRAVTDFDLPLKDRHRRRPLLRRAFAFALSGLAAAEDQGLRGMRAHVSLSRAATEERPLTAHVTFCGVHPGLPPYLADPETAQGAVAELSVSDLPRQRAEVRRSPETVSLLASDGCGRGEELQLTLSDHGPPFRVEVTRESGARTTYEGNTYGICLAKLQLDMEDEGLQLCCQGARPDTMSSSLLHASGGRHLYLVDPVAKKITDELVDIFDPAPYEAVATYAEQRKAFFDFTGMTDSGWQMPR